MKPEDAFAIVLKQIRQEKKITQENLALQGNLDRTFISLLERGLRQPSLTTILQIADALNIPPEQIVKRVHELIIADRT